MALFGLLSSMAMYGRTGKLDVYGPRALGSVLKFYDSFFGEGSNFEIEFHAVECDSPVLIHESKNVRVSAFPLRHKIECYGYRFDGIPSERHPEVPSYAYCSDTVSFPELADYVKGVRLLYHEATYMQDMSDKAALRWHSTTVDAARCALAAGAGKLVVGHYSSRITDFDAYLAECTAIFPDTVAAKDGDIFDF